MSEKTKIEVKEKFGWGVKIAVLLIITFQYAKSFSTPAIAEIAAAYSMIDQNNIKLIESIPSLMAIPGSLLVAVLERFMRKKAILWIAMLGTLIGGVAAGFMPETEMGFYGILACRCIMGLARGIIFPMSASFVADLFTGRERAQLMSFRIATGGISGIVFQLIGGFLAVLSWRYAFIGYAFIIPIILFVAIKLPEPEVKPIPLKSGKRQLSAVVWGLCIFACIWNVFQFSIFTNIALAISGIGIGASGESGLVVSAMTLATAVSGICYGTFLQGKFGGFDIPIGMTLMTVSYIVFTHFFTLPMYFVGSAIFGLGFGMFNSALLLQVTALLPRESATLGISIMSAFQNFGQFISVFVLAFLAPIMGAGATYAQLADWEVSWPLMAGLSIAVFITMGVMRNKRPEKVVGLVVENEE